MEVFESFIAVVPDVAVLHLHGPVLGVVLVSFVHRGAGAVFPERRITEQRIGPHLTQIFVFFDEF